VRIPLRGKIGLCKATAEKDKSHDHLLLFKCTHMLARIPEISPEYMHTVIHSNKSLVLQTHSANTEIHIQWGKRI